MKYYVYLYLSKSGSPYYVGKGKGYRYNQKHECVVPPKDRIVFIAKNLSGEEAIKLERQLIAEIGIDFLDNIRDSGGHYQLTEEQKDKISKKMKGKTPWNKGKKCKGSGRHKGAITIGDKTFASRTECASIYGVSLPGVAYWIQNGVIPQQIQRRKQC